MLFFTQVESMITPQNNQSVIGMRTGFQRFQNGADTMIDKTHGCEIGVGQASLLSILNHFDMSRGKRVVVDPKKVFR